MNSFRRFLLRIPQSIYDAMIEQAKTELPAECCGLLAGRICEDGAIAVVEAVYPLINELKSATEFLSDPRSHLNAERDIRKRQLDVLAVYHSHPTSAAIPSKRDLERNYSERVINLIIGLFKQEPEMQAWWLTESNYNPATVEFSFNPQSEILNPQSKETPVGVEPT